MKLKLLLITIALFVGCESWGQTTLLTENFGTTNSSLPTGWTSSNTTNGWNGNHWHDRWLSQESSVPKPN